MRASRYALIVAAALTLAFVGVNLVAGVWLKHARLDLTERRIYSLSDGAKQVLADLREPLELRF